MRARSRRWLGLLVLTSGLWVGSADAQRIMVGPFLEQDDTQPGEGRLLAWAVQAELDALPGVDAFDAQVFAREFERLKTPDLAKASPEVRAELARYTGCRYYVSGSTGGGLAAEVTDLTRPDKTVRLRVKVSDEDTFAGVGELAELIASAVGARVPPERIAGVRKLLAGTPGCLTLLVRALSAASPADRLTLLEEAVKTDESSTVAGFLLAQELATAGKRLEAISALRKVLQQRPDWPAAHYDLGNAYFDERRYEEAAQEYVRTLALDGDYGPAHENLVRALRAQNADAAKVQARYRELTAPLGENGLVLLTLGRLYHEAGNNVEAVKALTRAAQLRPEDAVVHYDLGQVLDRGGSAAQAKNEYLHALELAPNYAKAHNNLGFLYEGEGKLDVAIFHYLRAVEFDPGYALAFNNLGVAYERKGNLTLAVGAYRRATELTPKDPIAHFNLAVAFHRDRQYAQAMVEYKRVLELSANDKLTHFNLAGLCERLNQPEEAARHWEAVLKLNPDEKEKATAEAHLQSLRKQ